MSQNLQEVMMINRKINILMFALVMGILILPLAASRNSYAQEEGSEQERTTTRNKHIRERWESLTPQQKQELKARLQKWNSLSQEEKDKVWEKFKKYKDLSPEKKERIRKNWAEVGKLSKEQKRDLIKKHERWKSLSREQKDKILEKVRRFKEMSPEDQRQLMEKRKRWQSLSPEQKQELRERFKGRQEGFKGRGRNGPDRLKRRDQINEYLNKNDNSFREKGDRFDSDGAGRGSNNQSKPGKND